MNIVSGGSLRINTTGEAMTGHREPPTGTLSGTYSFTNTTFTFDPADDAAMTWTFRAGDGVPDALHGAQRARC